MNEAQKEHWDRVEERQAHLRKQLFELFETLPYKQLTLEIGCGHGHWLTGYAEAFPKKFCVGIDLKTKRIQKSTAKRDKRELENLCFLKAEGGEFLEALPDFVKFDELFLIFPDPWPKKRHFKNRIVQHDFLNYLTERLTDQAKIYFRTDYEPYYEWALEHIQENSNWKVNDTLEWPFELETFFQKFSPIFHSLIAVRND